MKNQLAIKIFKMDYEFLLKNYLNPELWQKEWTLFEFRFYKITMNLYSIYTKNEKIYFEISIRYMNPDTHSNLTIEKMIDFSLKIDNIDFLKRKINTAIWEGMQSLESSMIEREDEYQDLEEMRSDERERLRDIAEEFLEDNNITHPDIVEAYTDAYVDAYEKVYDMMQEYKSNRKFHVATDFYLTWLNSLEDDSKDKKWRLDKVEESLDHSELLKVQKEISEYQEYLETEEWIDEAKKNLESLN